MRNLLLASAAFVTLTLGMAAAGAEAFPSVGNNIVAARADSDLVQIAARRVCNRFGRDCRWVGSEHRRRDWRRAAR